MNRQVIYDVMKLKGSDFAKVQDELSINYHRGQHEAETDFRTRVLQEIDKQGKMRDLEAILS